MAQVNFLLPKSSPREAVIERVSKVLKMLDPHTDYDVLIGPHKEKRTVDQNALLWSIYTDILDRGGEDMGGWTKDDLHEFFLIDHFGSSTIEVFGKKRLVPLKRSKALPKAEFAKLVDHIVRFMAMRGVVIDMPGDL